MAEFYASLIEGVPGIGKSTLIDTLIRPHVDSSDPRRMRSFFHLAQTTPRDHLRPPRIATRWRSKRICSCSNASRKRLNGCTPNCSTTISRADRLPPPDALPASRHSHMVCCRAVWFAACDDRLQASAPDPDRSKETIWNRGIRGRADSPFLTQYALKFG